jgi:hypothetical protein
MKQHYKDKIIDLGNTNYLTKFERIIGTITYHINKKLITDYDTKPFVRYLIKTFNNKKIIGAEIGVCHGENAIDMLNKINFQKLYLIDSYTLYDEYKHDVPDNTQNFYDEAYEEIKKKMKPYKQVEIIKKFSNEAYKMFPDNFFDFIYIDTLHDYKYVYEDFLNWFPKIKPGGVYGGHGFNANLTLPYAITDISRKYNLVFDGCKDDWFIIKNKVD